MPEYTEHLLCTRHCVKGFTSIVCIMCVKELTRGLAYTVKISVLVTLSYATTMVAIIIIAKELDMI